MSRIFIMMEREAGIPKTGDYYIGPDGMPNRAAIDFDTKWTLLAFHTFSGIGEWRGVGETPASGGDTKKTREGR